MRAERSARVCGRGGLATCSLRQGSVVARASRAGRAAVQAASDMMRSRTRSISPGREASGVQPHLSQVHSRHTLITNSTQDDGRSTTVVVDSERAATAEAAGADVESGLGQPKRQRRLRNLGSKSLGWTPRPSLVAISMVYFVQGILGLSRLAISFFFKDELHVDPAQVAVLTGLSGIPWMVKPLYGFISDSVPLFGFRRRSYLVLCGLMGTVAWSTLATGVSDSRGAVACMILASLSTAFSDVVVDSIVVERARGHPQSVSGSLQSLCWMSSAVGGITSAYFSGSLVQDYGTRFVFGVTALFPLVVSASALLIDERRVVAARPAAAGGSKAPGGSDDAAASSSSSSSAPLLAGAAAAGSSLVVAQVVAQSKALWAAVRRKDILLPTAFVFLWQSTPSADSAMFYFQTNQLGFTPEFLGRVRLAASLAQLAGIALYNGLLKKVPLRSMLWWSMILGTVLGSSQLVLVSGLNREWGLPDRLFVLGDSVLLTVLGQVSFMPILVLAARLCPPGVEATLFATLMSILNSGAFVGGALGAGLTSAFGVTAERFDNLLPLVGLCVALQLAPAPFLRLLPPELDKEREEGEEEGAGGREGAAGKAADKL